ncbi:hypothetical protein GCM10023191_078510 [Actinoallomurus oryzae]|uniref:Chorismate-utilising enzyme C-terminal domain-containing protein n=1 Tax=Actinoallomurus oryzae TaxID=502180 RepID=A0ABP8QXF5_9ACTN
MTVQERVQHLASRVAGRLRDGVGPWPAFGALFPAITATGVPEAAALAALTRHEPGTRGLYGGAVLTVDTHGALDAALVLRTIFRHGEQTSLRAGAGVIRQSTPSELQQDPCGGPDSDPGHRGQDLGERSASSVVDDTWKLTPRRRPKSDPLCCHCGG